MLLYTALLNNQENIDILELEVFNPMNGRVFRYPLYGWNKGKELIDFACNMIHRSKKEKVTPFDNKNN
jgi:hypothetical protein